MTKEKFIEICEANGWSVTENSAGDFEIETYSPAGEDFSFSVCVGDENNAEYWRKVFDYESDFDPSEHAAMWYGQNRGESYSLRDLLDDAEAIKKMLEQLWRALLNSEDESQTINAGQNRKYENEAKVFAEAIRALAENEDALENLECYLSMHFDIWLQKFASTPESFVAEINSFAHIYDSEEANA